MLDDVPPDGLASPQGEVIGVRSDRDAVLAVKAQPPEREPLRDHRALADLRRGEDHQPVVVAALQPDQRIADRGQVQAHPERGVEAAGERRRRAEQVPADCLLRCGQPLEHLGVVEVLHAVVALVAAHWVP
ncbi:hypothetical protein ACFWVB_20020 [Streptomyces microflavus]|uniref:hypothetical protein n=1 Tax=Streptomyces microflavus TaxID=1919 RepID=UPI003652F8AA